MYSLFNNDKVFKVSTVEVQNLQIQKCANINIQGKIQAGLLVNTPLHFAATLYYTTRTHSISTATFFYVLPGDGVGEQATYIL